MAWLKRRKNTDNVRQPHISSQNEDYSFRRSRTLTGSASSRVEAAGETRAQIKSPRLKEYELRAHRRKLAAYLLAVLMALASLAWLLSQFVWQFSQFVSVYPLASNTRLDSAAYQRLVESYYADNPLERFRFILREEALTRHLQQQRPEIAAAVIEDGQGLFAGKLQIELRQPILAWRLGSTTYYVDGDGRAFTKNYYDQPRLTVQDNSGLSPASGALASNRILHFIGRTVTLVNQTEVGPVAQVVIPPGLTRQINLKLADKPYTIKTQLDRDPAGQAADIVNAVEYMVKHQLSPDYIDVRADSKAFYQ